MTSPTSMTIAFKAEGEVDPADRRNDGWLGQSLYLREICGREEGAPPPVDLAAERRNGEFVRALIRDGLVTAVHDVSDGGLLVALAEMAMAARIGAVLEAPAGHSRARLLVRRGSGALRGDGARTLTVSRGAQKRPWCRCCVLARPAVASLPSATNGRCRLKISSSASKVGFPPTWQAQTETCPPAQSDNQFGHIGSDRRRVVRLRRLYESTRSKGGKP